MKFKDFVQDWKTMCRLNVSDGWKYSQDQMIRDYILPILGEYPIGSITHLHVSKVINFCQSKQRSPQTIKHVYSVLNKIFSDARDHFEIIHKSPIKPAIHRPAVIPNERSFLTPDEARKLLEACESDANFGPAIWLQTFCGLRIGEVQGLKWGDIDWRNETILIRRTFNAKTNKFQEYTKNKTQIRVPMPEPLIAFLKNRKKSPSEFICKNKRGNYLSRNSYADALPRICKELGLPELSSHELRHTCSELWISCGASAEDIRRLFNHKSLSSTKTYIHRTDTRLKEISKKVNFNREAA